MVVGDVTKRGGVTMWDGIRFKPVAQPQSVTNSFHFLNCPQSSLTHSICPAWKYSFVLSNISTDLLWPDEQFSLDDWVALICCYVRSVLFIYFSFIPHICIFLLLKYRWRIMVFLLTWQFIFCGHICFYFKTEHNVFIYIYLNKRENKNHIVCHIVCISEQK